jgi:hypothetical protein
MAVGALLETVYFSAGTTNRSRLIVEQLHGSSFSVLQKHLQKKRLQRTGYMAQD